MKPVSLCVWGQDYEWEWVIALNPRFDPSFELEKLELDDLLGEQGWKYIWSVRLAMWQELVPRNVIAVEFSHDGLSGNGEGPITSFFDPEMTLGPVTLSGADFCESDRFYFSFSGGPDVFGLPGFALEGVFHQEFDDETGFDNFEHTFTRRDLLTIDVTPTSPEKSWADLTANEQGAVLANINHFLKAQIDEYAEVVLDASDLLCLIASHPMTHEAIRRSAVQANPIVLECQPWLK
jgi:hypothetical protein